MFGLLLRNWQLALGAVAVAALLFHYEGLLWIDGEVDRARQQGAAVERVHWERAVAEENRRRRRAAEIERARIAGLAESLEAARARNEELQHGLENALAEAVESGSGGDVCLPCPGGVCDALRAIR